MVRWLLPIVLICSSSFAQKDNRKHQPKFTPSIFQVTPLNSPVKGPTAKFLLKTPPEFEVEKLKYKIKNAGKILEKDMPLQNINLVNGSNGKELHIPVSKLSPGFYQLHLTVVDKTGKKEHGFRSAFHEYVRFVIDESLQVPIPDPKKNDATIAGIDSDEDGIRDDVQRWINETYASQPNLKLAMKQYATAHQNVLITANNKDLNIQATYQTFNAISCAIGVTKSVNQGHEESERVLVKQLNSKERLITEKKADLNFHGQGGEVSSNWLSFCQFEVE